MRLAALAILLSIFAGGLWAAEPVETPKASAPYAFSPAWTMTVERDEELKAENDGRHLNYLDRSSGKAKLEVVLEMQGGRLAIKVPSGEREWKPGDTVKSLRFNAAKLDEREDGKSVHLWTPTGGPNAQAGLHAFTAAPWYVLDWNGNAFVENEAAAEPLAWRTADALTLPGELAFLLPSAHGDLTQGHSFQQTQPMPYPLPWYPKSLLNLTYHVDEVQHSGGQTIAKLSFHGEISESRALVAWGGIRFAEVNIKGTASGRIDLDTSAGKLLSGEVKLELDQHQIQGGFGAQWKCKSQWRAQGY